MTDTKLLDNPSGNTSGELTDATDTSHLDNPSGNNFCERTDATDTADLDIPAGNTSTDTTPLNNPSGDWSATLTDDSSRASYGNNVAQVCISTTEMSALNEPTLYTNEEKDPDATYPCVEIVSKTTTEQSNNTAEIEDKSTKYVCF